MRRLAHSPISRASTTTPASATIRSAVEAALQITPFEHVVFGTDWPYLALPDADDVAPGLSYLGAERRALLEGEHAKALVPRLFS